ncbi:MAG: hypothetical protein Q8K99_08835, partial [Actinomycetota bacterium]|nr:hypothetical protein [Actinomycetota bacterium]
ITTIHTAPASQECVDCHETADVRTIHGATQAASCVVCHDGRTLPATTKCTSCHAYSPVDTKHYPTAEHAASDAGCDQCHYTDLKTEHFKSSAGPVSCVQCHETYVDGFTAPWDDSCAACHAVKHDRQADDHVSTRTDCAGSGCHDVGDVSVVHAGLSGGGCSACHTGPATPPTTTDCTSSGCHSAFHAGKTVAHTATTPASLGCGRCHDKDPLAGVNVEPVHAAAPEGACWVCHGNPARVPDVSLETAECASCHGVSGTEYHRTMNAKHTFGAMDPSCVSAGCHAAKTLPEAHAPYLARYPQYTDTCALCHLNADAGRIDWATASADCSTCHTVHGDITTIHTAPASQECVDCHETADVRTIHGATQAA